MTKRTVNVKSYQNTKIDAQRDTTETKQGNNGSIALEWSETRVIGG